MRIPSCTSATISRGEKSLKTCTKDMIETDKCRAWVEAVDVTFTDVERCEAFARDECISKMPIRCGPVGATSVLAYVLLVKWVGEARPVNPILEQSSMTIQSCSSPFCARGNAGRGDSGAVRGDAGRATP